MRPPLLRLALQLLIAAVFAAYFMGCWLRGGQTLAMKAWRIRLVEVSREGPARLLWRESSSQPAFPSCGPGSTATANSCTTPRRHALVLA